MDWGSDARKARVRFAPSPEPVARDFPPGARPSFVILPRRSPGVGRRAPSPPFLPPGFFQLPRVRFFFQRAGAQEFLHIVLGRESAVALRGKFALMFFLRRFHSTNRDVGSK